MDAIPEVEGHIVRFFYTTRMPHEWGSGESVRQTDPDTGAWIESIERARELAEKHRVGKWGMKRHVETTFGVSFKKIETEEDSP